MRNQLSHGYFVIDLDVVWKVIERDIPVLGKELEAALVILDRPSSPWPALPSARREATYQICSVSPVLATIGATPDPA